MSTHDNAELVRARGTRFSIQVTPVMTIDDILINSGLNILQLRDIILARAEEETCREIVHRIPVSPQLQKRLEEEAVIEANETDPVKSWAQANRGPIQLSQTIEAGDNREEHAVKSIDGDLVSRVIDPR